MAVVRPYLLDNDGDDWASSLVSTTIAVYTVGILTGVCSRRVAVVARGLWLAALDCP